LEADYARFTCRLARIQIRSRQEEGKGLTFQCRFRRGGDFRGLWQRVGSSGEFKKHHDQGTGIISPRTSNGPQRGKKDTDEIGAGFESNGERNKILIDIRRAFKPGKKA